MRKYPKTRRRSYTAKCPYCDGTYYAMGMGTHIREAHKMIYKTIARPTARPTAKPTAKPVAIPTAKPVAIPDRVIQNLSDITGKNLTECKRPGGQYFYTDQDIRILLGRIIIETYQPKSEVALFNQFNIMDLIEDFEHRFKCKFDDVRRTNQHIQPGKTAWEHSEFANKYMHLEYSEDYG